MDIPNPGQGWPVRRVLPGSGGCGIIGAMQSRRRHCLLLPGLACALLLGACGQKGGLYLAEDDPARAERDARGKAPPFPFPPETADWPPDPPAQPAADAGQ
jgi:predicted small lipoprotein YifL